MRRIPFFVCVVFFLSGFKLKAQNTLPDNMFLDTAFAPFLYSVASGDPTQHSVIIWTKVFADYKASENIKLQWQVADDSLFRSIVRTGETACTRQRDFTTQADVDGLLPAHHYFYRFITAYGRTSQTGKAQTLPDDSVKHFKVAVVSCAGVWSGYFNAYRRMGERADIDFIVHLGDYVYDDVDPDEQVRMPSFELKSPATLTDWRERHKYYLLDPDLRFARQNKTWITEWDNHDTHYKEREKTMDGITAFYEYLPIRMPDTLHPERIYRTFRFGQLADLNLIDMYLYRGKEEYTPGKCSVLGNLQDRWFKNQLLQSNATWHLTGSQEMMGSWLSKGIPKSWHAPGNGIYFDPDDWDGFPEDRNRFYRFIDSNHINNVVVLSGDLHMSFVMDLTPATESCIRDAPVRVL
jgi:alkaline phosphatase D